MNARHSTDSTAEMPTLGSQPADDDQPDLWPVLEEPEAAVPGPDADVLALGSELDQDPFDDDLAKRLERKAPRLKATRATLALAAGLLLVIGFVGGSLAQKQWGKAPTASNPFAAAGRNGANFPGGLSASGFAGGGAGRGNGGGAGSGTGTGGGSAPITGTVKLVDGTTVYIVTSDGQVLTVKTGGSTTVSQPGTLGSLTAGSTVSVTGQTGSDGTVTATAITKTK